MLTRNIYTHINADLTVSTLLHDKIFLVSNRTLFTVNIYTGACRTVAENVSARFIFPHLHDLVLVSGNTVTFATQKAETLQTVTLSDAVAGCKDNCVLLTVAGGVYFVRDYAVKKVRVVQRTREEVLDVSLSDTATVVLTRSGRVFLCEDVCRTERLLLNKEMFRVSYREESLWGVEFKNGRVYLKSNRGVEVCRVRGNLLVLVCMISNEGRYGLTYWNDNVFYLVDRLYVIRDVPLRVSDAQVLHLLDNVAVCSDRLFICEEDFKRSKVYAHIEDVPGADERVRDLFRFITIEEGNFHREKDVEKEEELIEFRKEVELFRSRYIDRLRVVLLEIKTLTLSFEEKNRELKAMGEEIEDRMTKVYRKRKGLVDSLKQIDYRLNATLGSQLSDVDHGMLLFRIKKCREAMANTRMCGNKDLARKLKLQRIILRGYIK